MTPVRKRRLTLVAVLLIGLGATAALALSAFRSNLTYFYQPSAVLAGSVPTGARFRLGGLVVDDSVRRTEGGLLVNFQLADCDASVPVSFRGILPDLFREGQGIVAFGRMDPRGVFVADEVLAKHDENYMPPGVADALTNEATGQSCMPAELRT